MAIERALASCRCRATVNATRDMSQKERPQAEAETRSSEIVEAAPEEATSRARNLTPAKELEAQARAQRRSGGR